MSPRSHQSLRGVLDLSEPSLTPQQSGVLESLLGIFIEEYGIERATEKGIKPAKLIHVRASSGKTLQPTPTSLSTINASTPIGTRQRISVLRHDCLIPDHHQCVVTRKFDTAEAKTRIRRDKNFQDDDGKLFDTERRGDFQYLEVAHILPRSLTKVASRDGNMTDSKKNVLRILDMFDPGITHLIDGPNIDSPWNALTISLDKHRPFSEFEIYFEPTGRPHEYRIHSVDSVFLNGPYFPVTRTLTRSPNDTINMPSPRLLAIHRAIARILELTGAGEYIEEIVRDLEEVTVETDGSTNLGDIVRLRLDGWIN